MIIVCGFVSIFLFSLAVTRVMIAIKIVDRMSQRSLHTTPTPRAGGVAIVLAYLGGMALMYQCVPQIFHPYNYFQIYLILGVLIFIAIINFVDDVSPLAYAYRLILQLFCGIIIASQGFCINEIWIPFVGYLELGWVAVPTTVLWIVSFTNIVNFMDGTDGLVAGCSIIGCIFLSIISLMSGNLLASTSLFALGVATAGFMFFNFPKAKIFMGDIGSHFLGFIFALHEINITNHALASGGRENIIPCLSTVILFGNFVFEVVFTLTRRVLAGKSIVLPHNDFIFHILYRNGWSHVKISLLHFCFLIVQAGLLYVSHSKKSLITSAVVIVIIQAIYTTLVLRKQKQLKEKA